MNQAKNVLVNLMASDHCLYKKLRLRHCCSNFGSSLYRHQRGLVPGLHVFV